MGLLNVNQILPGARTYGGEKTYANTVLKQPPTYTIASDTITFAGGDVEVEGVDYSLNGLSLAFNNLASAVLPGQMFVVCAVPQYNEPTSSSAATALGLNYYVQNNGVGETLAYPIQDANIAAGVAAAGGYQALAHRVYTGSASTSDITLFNSYEQQVMNGYDPRYSVFPMAPIGVSFVLAQVIPTDNSTKTNALYQKSYTDFQSLKSQVGLIYTTRTVLTVAAADARYLTSGKYYVVKDAFGYATLSDAQNANNPTAIPVTSASTTFATSGVTYVAVDEYTYPSYMPLGQYGKPTSVVNYLTIKDSNYLGRIDPIYLNNVVFTQRFAQPALSRLTLYGDPEPLVQVTVAGTSGNLTIGSPVNQFNVII